MAIFACNNIELTIMKKFLFLLLIPGLSACGDGPEPVLLPPDLAAPVATAATFINPDHFTVNWNDTPDATAYELEIATDIDFSTIVVTEKGVESGFILWGTESMTQYFYRVRGTISGGDPSPNSNIISLYTLPVPPVANQANNVTNSSFTASWSEVPGISNYLLYLSLDNFTSDPPIYVDGYDGVDIAGLAYDVTSLDSTTIYYYAIKAKGDESISFFSNSIFVETTN